MVYASVNSSRTHSPPPGLLWGICPSCQPRRGMGTAGIDWCITVMEKENICENIIQLSTPSPWNPGKILGTHTSNIWEFSSSKGIHDTSWIPESSYRILCWWNLKLILILFLVAFWINLPVAVFWNPKPRIMDFTNNFPDSEILQAKISWIPGVRIPLHILSFVTHCHW